VYFSLKKVYDSIYPVKNVFIPGVKCVYNFFFYKIYNVKEKDQHQIDFIDSANNHTYDQTVLIINKFYYRDVKNGSKITFGKPIN
jgi:hypothetical protein